MKPDRAQFRDSHRYIAAVASEAARPVLRAYARAHARSAPTAPTAWRRGVILSATHIGDVLYRTCSLEHLRAALPECEWTYVATGVGAELLRGNPAVTATMVVDEYEPGLTERLAGGEFDVALCTDNIQHHTGLLTAVRAGIPNRVAFGSKGLTGLATIAVPVPRASWPAQFQRMVQALSGGAASWPLRPRVYLDDADERVGALALDALPHRDATITVAVAVTTRQRIGVFPPALFERILRAVLAFEPATRIVLVGSTADRPVLARIAESVGARAMVAEPVGVRALIALLRRCSVFLGSDSGPRHMANAAGLPVFFVRNMAVPEIEAGRYCDTEVDLAPRGEYLDAARNHAALEAIDADAAAGALVEAARAHTITTTARDASR